MQKKADRCHLHRNMPENASGNKDDDDDDEKKITDEIHKTWNYRKTGWQEEAKEKKIPVRTVKILGVEKCSL